LEKYLNSLLNVTVKAISQNTQTAKSQTLRAY